MSKRRRIVLNVVPLPAEKLTMPDAPVTVLPIEVEEGRKVVVFQIAGDEEALARAESRDGTLSRIAQALGNLVAPVSATLVVTPPGATLTAYEVRAPGRKG